MSLKEKLIDFIEKLREDATELVESDDDYSVGCGDARIVISNELGIINLF
jgi:hypothetical protein